MNFWELTLHRWILSITVLLLTSLAAFLSDKVGIGNLSIEGNVCLGGFFFSFFSLWIKNQFFGLTLSILFGILANLLFFFLLIYMGVNFLIAGIVFNIFTFTFVPFFLRVYIKTFFIRCLYSNPELFFHWFSAYFLLPFLFLGGMLLYFFYSPILSNLSVIQYNKKDSRFFFQNSNKYLFFTLAISSGLAIIAGAVSIFNLGNLFNGQVTGSGFIGLIVAWAVRPLFYRRRISLFRKDVSRIIFLVFLACIFSLFAFFDIWEYSRLDNLKNWHYLIFLLSFLKNIPYLTGLLILGFFPSSKNY